MFYINHRNTEEYTFSSMYLQVCIVHIYDTNLIPCALDIIADLSMCSRRVTKQILLIKWKISKPVYRGFLRPVATTFCLPLIRVSRDEGGYWDIS